MSATTSFINSMLTSGFTGTITMELYKTGLPSLTGVQISGGGYAPQTLTMGTASAKTIAATSNAVFSNLPTGSANTVVAWGVKKGGTLIDEGTLSSPFTADITNNELEISYSFEITA